jgi:hypothetical protein
MVLKCRSKRQGGSMRRYWTFLLFLIALSGPGTVNAAYVIKLKNGKEFITARYWQQGKQIMFDTYDGVFGVDKSFISSIDVSDKPPAMKSQNAEMGQETPKEPVGKEEEKSKKASTSTEPINEKDDPIQKEFDALKAQAKSLNGMLTSELEEYAKKLAAFKKKLQLEGKTNEYLKEFREVHEMGDAVEQALKNRR